MPVLEANIATFERAIDWEISTGVWLHHPIGRPFDSIGSPITVTGGGMAIGSVAM